MKTLAIALALIPLSAVAATGFTFYASPLGYYKCSGYATSTCTDFESSDPAHAVTMVVLAPPAGGMMQVQLYVDGQHYRGATASSGAQFEAQDMGSGQTLSATVNWVKTRHCVTTRGVYHCTDRYLAESGTISLP